MAFYKLRLLLFFLAIKTILFFYSELCNALIPVISMVVYNITIKIWWNPDGALPKEIAACNKLDKKPFNKRLELFNNLSSELLI